MMLLNVLITVYDTPMASVNDVNISKSYTTLKRVFVTILVPSKFINVR